MSFSQYGTRNYHHNGFRSSSSSANLYNNNSAVAIDTNNYESSRDLSSKHRQRLYSSTICGNTSTAELATAPPLKRRRYSLTDSSWDRSGNHYQHPNPVNSGGNAPSTSSSSFLRPSAVATIWRDASSHALSNNNCSEQTKLEEDVVFMSRDEIERGSPSRKDGIDLIRETHLRYSYCAFLQNLGMQLDLPQTTIGTAMVLCHRFFVHRSHACHDRFLISTAALFLAAKSEETPCPLNTVLRASCEICHKHDVAFFSYLLPIDWFEQYRERVIEAEQMILTTLDFELNVHHPYIPLTSVLNKLGLSQTVLVNLALNLVSEGVLTRILCSPV